MAPHHTVDVVRTYLYRECINFAQSTSPFAQQSGQTSVSSALCQRVPCDLVPFSAKCVVCGAQIVKSM